MAEPKKNFLLALAGLSGSGKTTVAREVVKELRDKHDVDIVVLEADPIRKEILGVSPTTRLDKDAYSWEVTKKVIAEMDQRTEDLFAEGKSVVWTSILVQERQRKEKQEFAEKNGVNFVGIWLEAPEHVLLERVEQRSREDNDASDAGVDIVKRQIERQQKVTDWPKVDAGQSVTEVAKQVVDLMSTFQVIEPKNSQRPDTKFKAKPAAKTRRRPNSGFSR